MDIKKNPEYNLNNKRSVFFHLGTVISLSFVILAFEWHSEQTKQPLDVSGTSVEYEEMIDIPITNHYLPPPPATILSREIVETNREIINVKELVEDNDLSEYTHEGPSEEGTDAIEPRFDESIEEVFDNISILSGGQMASPQGGMEAFYDHLRKNIRMPEMARRSGVSGKVYIHFEVDKDGSLSNVKVIKGIGFGCDEEAVEAIKKSPKWNPATYNGRKVKFNLVVPVYFSLQ